MLNEYPEIRFGRFSVFVSEYIRPRYSYCPVSPLPIQFTYPELSEFGNCRVSGRIHASMVISPVVVGLSASASAASKYCVAPSNCVALSPFGSDVVAGDPV